MKKPVTITQDDLYAARIFFNSVLPLLKVVINDRPKFKKKFAGKSLVFQVSALYDGAEGGKMGTHLVFDKGDITCHVSELHPDPDIDLEFSDLKKFIFFFTGRGMPLPKLKGVFTHLGSFISVLQALLDMANLLGLEDAPEKAEDAELLVKLYFYLLPKAGHEKVHEWVLSSPDRAYAFAVEGYPELQSYIRVKEGNSKAGRGEYPRCKPFLTLRFDSVASTLGVLMGKADMIESIASGALLVEGAPEFAGVVGEFLFTVGDYAKGAYLDAQ